MIYPPLIKYASEGEYYRHYIERYCKRQIYTFDDIRVYFSKDQFKDAFFESSSRVERKKDFFSFKRAERIDWIEVALSDKSSEIYSGWDRDKRIYTVKRRVILVHGNYVVIIQMKKDKTAFFITAYIAGENTLKKIKNSPRLYP